MPANQTMGEGLFFEFNQKTVNRWVTMYEKVFERRYNQPAGDLGKALKEERKNALRQLQTSNDTCASD